MPWLFIEMRARINRTTGAFDDKRRVQDSRNNASPSLVACYAEHRAAEQGHAIRCRRTVKPRGATDCAQLAGHDWIGPSDNETQNAGSYQFVE